MKSITTNTSNTGADYIRLFDDANVDENEKEAVQAECFTI